MINIENNTASQENYELVPVLIQVKSKDDLQNILNKLDTTGVLITDSLGIIVAKSNIIDTLKNQGITIIKEDLQLVYTLNETTPIEASGAPTVNNIPTLMLRGKGVLVGIVDTGIDYLNDEFTKEDDTTRIYRIWDQTLVANNDVDGIRYGIEYTDEQINEAIKLKKNGGDPYSIVATKDEIGHGTMVAGIAGGRGKNPKLKGAAPDCDFIIVKLNEATKYELQEAYINVNTKVPCYTSWNIILAIRYVMDIAAAANRPIVLYVPLGTNFGSHEGTSAVSSAINRYDNRYGTIIITTTGNQGNTETHTEGKIEKDNDIKDIELKVEKEEKVLPIEIWINQANIIDLAIISPSGEEVGNLTPKLSKDQKISFFVEQTEMNINYIVTEQETGDILIVVKAINLKPGIWKFRLTGKKVIDAKYDAWLPQRDLIDNGTKFLEASNYTTLTVPSTASGTISVAYYNQQVDAIVAESGRGYTRGGRIKPDVAAGGVDALVITPGGGTRIVTGASIAGAVVTGGVALMLQLTNIEKNDPLSNVNKFKAYIRAGAKERPGDIYPNREWGYGMFDLEGVVDVLKNIFSPELNQNRGGYEEYNIGNLYIRKPREMENH